MSNEAGFKRIEDLAARLLAGMVTNASCNKDTIEALAEDHVAFHTFGGVSGSTMVTASLNLASEFYAAYDAALAEAVKG